MDAQQSIPLIDPPSDPCSLGTDFLNFLQQFQRLENAPYVHPKAISFNDAAHRANWIASMKTLSTETHCQNSTTQRRTARNAGLDSSAEKPSTGSKTQAGRPSHGIASRSRSFKTQSRENTWWSSIQTNRQTQNQAREQQLYSRDYNESYSSGYARTKQNTSAYGIQLIKPTKGKSSAYFIRYARYRRWQQWEIRTGKAWKTYELRTVLKLNMSKYK